MSRRSARGRRFPILWSGLDKRQSRRQRRRAAAHREFCLWGPR